MKYFLDGLFLIFLFIKYLAAKAGVGLRFVREMERGKTTLRLDKINVVLALFGKEVGVVSKGGLFKGGFS